MDNVICKFMTDTCHVQAEGEEIAPGDVVCEIQTDKAVVSMEVDDEGVLAKIFIQADTGSSKVHICIS